MFFGYIQATLGVTIQSKNNIPFKNNMKPLRI